MGCRRAAPATEFVRVVRRDGGRLALGAGLPGRGAWLCRGSAACLEQAARRRSFERALRAPVAPGAVEELRRELGLARDVRGWIDTPAP